MGIETENIAVAPLIRSEAAVTELESFLQAWTERYIAAVSKIDLFNAQLTAAWAQQQRLQFVRLFYHVRGHFYKFLWLLGNHAPNKAAKEQIVYNIIEEFGGDNPSHEELYYKFVRSLGFDVENEFISEEYHHPVIKEFNIGHLQWLQKADWVGKWSAFSAYERLDNIDYEKLLALAQSLGVTGDGLTFFIIHNKADHFERTYEGLIDVWNTDKYRVQEAFEFIAQHQIKMWSMLAKNIFGN